MVWSTWYIYTCVEGCIQPVYDSKNHGIKLCRHISSYESSQQLSVYISYVLMCKSPWRCTLQAKCARYWPDTSVSHSTVYEDLEVIVRRRTPTMDYTTTNFLLRHREVRGFSQLAEYQDITHHFCQLLMCEEHHESVRKRSETEDSGWQGCSVQTLDAILAVWVFCCFLFILALGY